MPIMNEPEDIRNFVMTTTIPTLEKYCPVWTNHILSSTNWSDARQIYGKDDIISKDLGICKECMVGECFGFTDIYTEKTGGVENYATYDRISMEIYEMVNGLAECVESTTTEGTDYHQIAVKFKHLCIMLDDLAEQLKAQREVAA